MTATPALQLENDFISGTSVSFPNGTPIPGPYLNQLSNDLDTFSQSLCAALGAGLLSWPSANSFALSVGTGANVNAASGAAIAYSSAHGAWVPLRSTSARTNAVTGGIPAGTWFLFASAGFSSTPTLDSAQSGYNSIAYGATAVMDGGVLLAKAVSTGSAITSLVDMRDQTRLVPWDPFGMDPTTTTGLIFGTKKGVTKDSSSVYHLVAASTSTLAASTANQFLQVNPANGALSVTTTPNNAYVSLWSFDTDGANITRADRLFPAAQLGGAAGVASFTATAPLTNTGTSTDPVVAISAGGITDTYTGNRTIDQTQVPATDTDTPTKLLSYLANRIKHITNKANWKTDGDIQLDAVATHVAAAAPHSGHLKADGTVASTADQNLGGFKYTNAADGVAATDLATVGQMSALAGGYIPARGVKAAATGNVNIANPGTAVFDGITLTNPGADRVLLPNQTTTTENGVYIWNGSAVAMTRSSDLNSSGELVPGVRVPVEAGPTYGHYALYIYSAGTMGTDPILWQVDAGSVGGEANTASNQGSGQSLFYQKSGIDLQFYGIAAADSTIAVALDGTNKNVTVGVNQANLDVANFTNLVGPTKGGTGLSAFGIGSFLIATAANVWSALAGNTTTTRKLLFSVGVSGVATAPFLDTIQSGDLPIMGASGGSHAPGAVGDPGATAGATRYWREDGSWSVPAAATPGVVPLDGSASPIAIIPANGNIFKASSAADRTLDAPGSMAEGQWFEVWWKNTDSSSHTLTLNAAYAFSANVSALPTVPAGKTLLLVFRVIDGVATVVADNLTI